MGTIKTVQDKSEPAIEILKETQKYIPLHISVVCDMCTYVCNVKQINIIDTLAFEVNCKNKFDIVI